MAVRLADRLRGGEAVAECCGEIGVERGDRLGRKTAFTLADGGKGIGHGFAPLASGEGAEIRRDGAGWLVYGHRGGLPEFERAIRRRGRPRVRERRKVAPELLAQAVGEAAALDAEVLGDARPSAQPDGDRIGRDEQAEAARALRMGDREAAFVGWNRNLQSCVETRARRVSPS